MSRTLKEIKQLIEGAVSEHERFWQEKEADMRRYRNVYSVSFWKDLPADETSLRVEVSDGYSYIESYIASLFSKAPAIAVESYDMGPQDKDTVKTICNRFFYDKRNALENASRMSLIYPMAFLKLAPQESTDPLERVSVRACEPWSVILDRDADLWEKQRYIAHIYWLPLPEAKEKFGAKQFKPVQKEQFFSDSTSDRSKKHQAYSDSSLNMPEDYLYIKVIEFYDMLYDRLYIWSPNYVSGDKLLQNTPIPVRTYDDQPLSSLVPLYYSRMPDRPMDGLSTMARIYDQIYEKNIIRTFWANAVRRDSRQYIVKESMFDDDSLAKITAGVDGAIIPVDAESLSGLIMEVPTSPISSNHDRYLSYVEQDMQRGSILAPFTKGEATKATATEVAALAQYTASEIGRMARERDQAIERLAELYIRMVGLLIDEGEKPVVLVNKKPVVIMEEKLNKKVRFAALDQAATPISTALKNQQLIGLVPILTQLGVAPAKIRDQLIRDFDLPEEFLSQNDPAAEPAGSGGALRAPGELPESGPTGVSEQQLLADELRGRAPSKGA